jgi:hypothetical protein
MTGSGGPLQDADPEDARLAAIGHPRGTLAVVAIFGLLFGLGWLLMYIYGFLARGATH